MDRGRESVDNPGMVSNFFSFLGSRENIPLVAAFAVIVSVVLAWLSPAEATLGQAVKLVYMHAALMWVAFGLLTLGAILGLLFLVLKRRSLSAWSYGSTATAVALLLTTGLLGSITAQITWGRMNWTEPRLLMLGEILLVGLAVLAVAGLSSSAALQSATNILFASVAWGLLLRTELVMHPDSPIFKSESLAIKVFPLLITASLAFAALQAARYLAANLADKVDTP